MNVLTENLSVKWLLDTFPALFFCCFWNWCLLSWSSFLPFKDTSHIVIYQWVQLIKCCGSQYGMCFLQLYFLDQLYLWCLFSLIPREFLGSWLLWFQHRLDNVSPNCNISWNKYSTTNNLEQVGKHFSPLQSSLKLPSKLFLRSKTSNGLSMNHAGGTEPCFMFHKLIWSQFSAYLLLSNHSCE